MADNSGMIASAVIIPESLDHAESPSGVKRRQSAASDSGSSKRPRLSEEPTNEGTAAEAPSNGQEESKSKTGDDGPLKTGKDATRQRGGRDEERQRGRRLFGALLGTLSQSTDMTAQRRRAEIERKQRTKLREAAEEFDERQRQRRDELIAERRIEQKKYDEQSMRIRHSNMLATAHFMKTETDPPLYYLPWQLRPEEADRIEQQKKNVNARIDEEELDAERRKELDQEKLSNDNAGANGVEAVTGDQKPETEPDSMDAPTSAGTDIDPQAPPPVQPPVQLPEAPSEPALEPVPESVPERENGPLDDAEELDVEGEAGEDPLIY